jgi:hypothetical protein
MNNNKQDILIKTPFNCEMTLEKLCYREYCKINNLMNLIENTFNVKLNDYPELRHEILDISNFIKRLPDLEREVL